jgi:hypothetical protein
VKEIPSTNIQAPEKLQAPNNKSRMAIVLELADWCFSGAWGLDVGAFKSSAILIKP